MTESELRCGSLPFLLLALLYAPAPARGAPPPDGPPAAGEIHGRVLDADSGKPIWLANVGLRGTRLGGSTDEQGRFVIRAVPPGLHDLRITHVAYETLLHPAVRVEAGASATVDAAMTPRASMLREITVTPGTFSFMESGAAARQTMSREEIETVPQLGEDVFRAVNRLPGLSSGDYSAHFSIRGGRHDETLILLDGLEIYEPYHLKDFNEGAISIVDVKTIEGVELMTGGFGAEYGNKRSGVFNITSRRPVSERTRYDVGVSFMNARALGEGTFAGDRGSWLVSARRGYLDLVFNIINQADLPSPVYYDVFSKFRYELDPRHTLSLNLLHAGDSYTFDAEGTTGFQDSIKTRELANNHYDNSYAWLTLRSALGQKVVVRNMVSAGLVTKDRDGTEKYVESPGAIYAIANKRDFSVLGLKQDWMYELSNAIFLTGGLDLRHFDVDYTFTNEVGQDPNDPSADPDAVYPIVTRSSLKGDGTTLGLYLSSRVRVLEPLTVEVGARHDRADYTNDSDLSPRVSALIRVAPRTNLRLGWGLYRQIHGIEDLAVINGQNEYFPSELSRQWTAAVERGFAGGATLRVEGYYKKGSNLRPRYRNWKGGIDVFPETNEDRILVYPDESTSKGMEVYYQRDLGERFALRGSYALAFVDERASRIENVNDPDPLLFDENHPGPQDQRHALNVDWTYRPRQNWSINTSYAFHTGWPATLEEMYVATTADGGADFNIRPLEVYGDRLPAYHRMDVRATKRYRKAGGDLSFFVELVNLTNHENVFGYDYFKGIADNGDIQLQRDVETWFTILPSLGVSWRSSF